MSNNPIKLCLAQLNATVGDIAGNTKQAEQAIIQAQQEGCQIILFPELFITGYPPEDLLFRKAFLDESDTALEQLKRHCQSIYCIMSHPKMIDGKLYNCASVLHDGEIIAVTRKQCLPNYRVFDERRYFNKGQDSLVLDMCGMKIGIIICEDIWEPEPMAKAVANGAQCVLVSNASPFAMDKADQRKVLLQQRVERHNTPIAYVNLVGGQDDLVFDGGSMVLDKQGRVCLQGDYFESQLLYCDLNADGSFSQQPFAPEPMLEQKTYDALVMGLRDYVHKNGFQKVILGLSGGIDSGLSLAIAVDALGKENITTVTMPSRYNTELSNRLAKEQAELLGVTCLNISIEPTFEAFLDSLKPIFANEQEDITEQNIQARCRGTLLMAMSNKFDHLVLTTGNRSELAMGYATLYGDMAGAFCVLKDVPKTWVYRLANYRNTLSHVIPETVITRPPTAELAANQKDLDSLPPYETLDAIIELSINQEKSVKEIVAQGFDETITTRVVQQIKRNEYKRRQAPVGVRLNTHAFGRDRRYPITNGFKDCL